VITCMLAERNRLLTWRLSEARTQSVGGMSKDTGHTESIGGM